MPVSELAVMVHGCRQLPWLETEILYHSYITREEAQEVANFAMHRRMRDEGAATLQFFRERTIRQAEKLRAADTTRPKEWLEIEKVRPIGFIGKDILALEKKIADPSEIIKQTQGFEISRLLLNQPREQEQHPGIDR